MNDNTERENIAQTLARELPEASIVYQRDMPGGGHAAYIAVPKTMELKTIDDEKSLSNPRRTESIATLVEPASFLAFVAAHKTAEATVWCDFNPKTYALKFVAVFDEHRLGLPGWRKHQAAFQPRLSVEWDTWIGMNGKAQAQLAFAEYLEANEKDIAGGEKMPSSLQMMTMATAFEANSEKRFKSKVRLQSGGIALEYVNTDDEQTIETMKLFERFQIGIPVFWSLPEPGEAIAAWPIEARLKYSAKQAGVTFWYDLIRPDIVHERAAMSLIGEIRAGLGDVPLRMGSAT